MRMLTGVLMALAMSGFTSAEDKKEPPIDGKKLVGKWEPKEAKKEMMVIEFTKDGKVIATSPSAPDLKIEGTYKLDGNKLTINAKFMDMEKTEVVTITKLTDDELIGKNDKGKEETFTRVKLKKEK